MTSYQLSEGSLQHIFGDEQVSDPIVQVLDIKLLFNNCMIPSERKRYILSLYDGKNTTSSTVLSIKSSSLINVKIFSIIKLKHYVITTTGALNQRNKKFIIILEIELIADGDDVGQKIGESLTSSNELDINIFTNNSLTPTSVKKASKESSVPNLSFIQSKKIHPIEALNPYFGGNWVIKARVVNKSDMRVWSNAKRNGILFTFDLMDATGEIRCTTFCEMAEKFYDFLEVDKVYLITKCEIKFENSKFNQLKNCYEMTTTKNTIIEECKDESDVPQIKFNFSTIAEIEMKQLWSLVDIIGVCTNAAPKRKIPSRTDNKRQLLKREIQLVDQSRASVEVTLWGSLAEKFDMSNNSTTVVAIKSAQVGEFAGGKNLSVLQNSHIKINPPIIEYSIVKDWYETEGKTVKIKNISERAPLVLTTPWKTFKKIQDKHEEIAENNKGVFYQTIGTVVGLESENYVYRACPNENCLKKVKDLFDDTYECKSCGKTYKTFTYRLLLVVRVADWQSSEKVTIFAKDAEKMLGKTSQEMGDLMDKDLLEKEALGCFKVLRFKQFLFKCRTQQTVAFTEKFMKTVVLEVESVNHEEYNKYLVLQINERLSSKKE